MMNFISQPMTNPVKTEHKELLFSASDRTRIDKWIAKYPPEWQQSAVMAALRIVQESNGGSLTTQLMDDVAAYLDMPAIAVYEVATFYTMYELKPVGRHKICLCTNVSCMVNGSGEIEKYLQQKLGIGYGQITEDGKFSMKEVECLAACGGAPMMQIGNVFYENLTPEKLDSILGELE